MRNFKNVLLAALFFVSATVLGQTKLTGIVVDEMGEPLPGASIVVKGTANGTSADFDGKFMLKSKSNSGTVVVSFVGYLKKEITFSTSNLGTIKLEPSNVLDEIVIVGSGIIDLAEDRKTPVAVSTIRAAEIQAKAGAWDLPEVLKSTPSVQAVKGGAFGEGQMYLRGFDQTNTAFLLNGQPINGMEDGKMYWSNWQGVMDVANAVQVQRGLGSSKLAISSVGGTVNIVTKTIDNKEGGFVQQMVGNNGYTKSTVSYSTGVSEKGWSFTGLFGHWQGNGYVDNTHGAGQTYFLSFGYQPNENNTFNFMLTGAPQSHAVAGRGDVKDFLDNGIRFNDWNTSGVNSPNTLGNSNVYPGGRNVYHKPVANLSWDWTINDKSSLSTVLYGSLGRGAFVSLQTDRDSGAALYGRGSNNNHNWFGLVSNYNNKLNENFNLNVGADIRTYNGIHFRSANDFIGVSSVDVNTNSTRSDYSTFIGEPYTLNNTFGGVNAWDLLFNSNNDHKQRFGYDYEEVITYYGTFAQLEYSKDALSAFFQGAISNQEHQREEFLRTQNVGKSEKSKKVSNLGYNLKAGLAYELNENNKVFANAGYYSRQPYHEDLFLTDRLANDFAPGVENQKVLGLEAGYQFKSEFVSANLNIYNTEWSNRTISNVNRDNFDTPEFRSFKTQGVKQIHRGAELELFTKPLPGFKLNGFISYGDWKYDGNGTEFAYDNSGALLGTSEVSVDGFEVGGGAQTSAGISGSYKILSSLTVDANWNYYDRLFSDAQIKFAPVELPSYNLTDIGLTFKPKLKEGTFIKGLQFRVNVNNVFDTLYLERLQESREASSDPSENWNGININNRGRFGYGRTWNGSIRFNF
ncbi:TonB-dependent receptor [Tenacibaculum ovolyticum]|uniref:TonB-dependent receptor n=1 Tax=Tenacibaculum ovolyticum TaxID=104270 RepID=UPI0003F81A45|nr:TonB-dependent receptor [Tenacibaculum ovolyticum]